MYKYSLKNESVVSWLIGLGVFLPIFFTLSGGLYRASQVMTDSGGVVITLPLPISILTCCIAILYFIPRIKFASKAIWTIFLMVASLAISFLMTSEGVGWERKLLMALQLILPFSGLVMGQLVVDKNNSIAKAFFVVLWLIIPVQLLESLLHLPWSQGNLLSDQVLFFTIYSHIQFVTLIFVGAFAYAISHLYQQFKLSVLGLIFLMFFYVLKSWSYLTIGAYLSVILIFFFLRTKLNFKSISFFFILLFILIVVSINLARSFEREEGKSGILWHYAGSTYNKLKPLIEGETPQNIHERIKDWRLYSDGIIESPKSLLFGRAQPMPREIRTSAHNWYIDTVYTFGLIGVLPVFGLIIYCAWLCWSCRHLITSQTWWLVGIVFFLVAIDSNFKVTLRQPYPGIFAFFMWGLLLTRLNETKKKLDIYNENST